MKARKPLRNPVIETCVLRLTNDWYTVKCTGCFTGYTSLYILPWSFWTVQTSSTWKVTLHYLYVKSLLLSPLSMTRAVKSPLNDSG